MAIMLQRHKGHHIDLAWSENDKDLTFSFRWFSHFFRLEIKEREDTRGIESLMDGAEAIHLWHLIASELFADLFEDWMRGSKRQKWDCAEPSSLNLKHYESNTGWLLRLNYQPGNRADQIREKTYKLFESGLHSETKPPTVRDDMFGKHTSKVIEHYREAKKQFHTMYR